VVEGDLYSIGGGIVGVGDNCGALESIDGEGGSGGSIEVRNGLLDCGCTIVIELSELSNGHNYR
jgi:hypothetical protein